MCDHIYIKYNNEFAKIMEWSTNTNWLFNMSMIVITEIITPIII